MKVLQFSFQHVDQVNFSCKRTQTQLQNHFSTTPCPSHETLKGMFKKENVNALEHSHQMCQMPNIWHLAHQTQKIEHHEVC